MNATAALWLTIIAIGVYHGLNPAMGWPIAVANGMAARRPGAVFTTLLPLSGGHFAAMAVVLLPFAALGWYLEWSRAIRLGAGALVLLFGIFEARPAAPSTSAGAGAPDATCMVVVPDGHRAWRGADAGAVHAGLVCHGTGRRGRRATPRS